jgi:hypothetical protein
MRSAGAVKIGLATHRGFVHGDELARAITLASLFLFAVHLHDLTIIRAGVQRLIDRWTECIRAQISNDFQRTLDDGDTALVPQKLQDSASIDSEPIEA